MKPDISGLQDEHAADISAGQNPPALRASQPKEQVDSLASYIHWLMDQDRKSTALKSLQGKIWKEGYDRGDLHATVFPDVRPAFERWRKAGAEIAVFSSGSVLAQKMLFAHTNEADLTSYIAAHFDTTIGSKLDANSYEKIATELKRSPGEILFISDSLDELNAASSSGMHTCFSMRPGNNAEARPVNHTKIEYFDHIMPAA